MATTSDCWARTSSPAQGLHRGAGAADGHLRPGSRSPLGSRTIRVRHFPGHTGGDSVVLIPDAKVVFAGDLFWRYMLPNLVDASTQPGIDTLDALAKNEPDSTFVPGHGDVGNALDVVAFREYLVTLRKLVADARPS